jgi:hypothetical protein
MDAFTGMLLRNGEVVADGVSGRLSVEWSPSQDQAWSGFFTMPAGSHVELNEVLELALTDGRRAPIKIERVNQTGAGMSVSFGRV